MMSLLELPGDIRNIIYGFCMNCLPRDRLCLTRAMSTPQQPQVQPQPHYKSLTQASKQLRNEFLPLYMKNNLVYVTLEELPSYLATFFPEATNKTMQTYIGNFIAIVPAEPIRRFDVFPLVRLRTYAPRVSFVFQWFMSYVNARLASRVKILNYLTSADAAPFIISRLASIGTLGVCLEPTVVIRGRTWTRTGRPELTIISRKVEGRPCMDVNDEDIRRWQFCIGGEASRAHQESLREIINQINDLSQGDEWSIVSMAE
ncbi:hypothetical protein P153DRAFT_100544 [Dothidotthia symphoricarpi CBS 119687]|uniref:F-box domain-containing protein n=1 Tax=Dothidotthia symphoricarpi CBS 119687 TaxID=1392245 RepID=A0A6A6AQS6_9PLEO|nr:uncharacterized protein P153DRAFT_100544 [Dothidotthia symphoricarpi CBS 119687]KAF2133886.1 hypothetical protein P153DRAFT_100544 [Dothidotthia symphoricarpi CBS 119687]